MFMYAVLRTARYGETQRPPFTNARNQAESVAVHHAIKCVHDDKLETNNKYVAHESLAAMTLHVTLPKASALLRARPLPPLHPLLLRPLLRQTPLLLFPLCQLILPSSNSCRPSFFLLNIIDTGLHIT